MLYKYILKDKFLPYYREWLKEREDILTKNNLSHNTLFIKDDGTPATEGTVRSWISTMEKILGVPFYAHSLRHYIVSEFSRKNIPPELIQELIGWSGISMIQVYNDVSPKDRAWAELENLK